MTQEPAKKRDRRQSKGRLRAILVIVVILLLAATVGLGVIFVRLLQPPGAPAAERPDGLTWVKSLYGFGPAKDEQLLEPTSVAIAPNGDIYATDPQRARIMRFTAEGYFRSLVHTGGGGVGTGMFARPESIAVDSDGNLYVADPVANKIIVFDPADKFVREWQTDLPKGVGVFGNDVYVLTTGRLSVFTRQGGLKGSFGERGKGPGQIDAYQGVVSDGTRVYVADALNSRVVAFKPSGDVVWTSPQPPAAPSRTTVPAKDATASPESTRTSETTPTAAATETLEATPTPVLYDLPQDIVLDGAGRLVVIDAFAFQLVAIDARTGEVIARYGDSGTEDGQFFYPTGIDYDRQRDWFAVADTRNNRVQIVRIPDSGATVPAAAQRIVNSPWKYCAFPLLFALLALLVALVSRSRERKKERIVVSPAARL